jgi:pimeloyl-ACP methyl ester carboxylesterase
MGLVYLHGFASSPRSSKAGRFARECAKRGVGYACPDFNQPAFETLTVTRMVQQTGEAIATLGAPVALVGSSLGAFVALHVADRLPGAVERLVLLAPALDFGGNRLRQLGDHGVAEWKARGRLAVFHYADDVPRDVDYGLYEDAARFDALALQVAHPALVFQGTRDASVDPGMVSRWARTQPRVTLRMLDDDHQLTASIDSIWEESAAFLGLPEAGR